VKKHSTLILGIATVVAIYATSAWWHVFHGALNPDEGFYAVATRAVAQGEMPYRDFGFTQPPLVLYANNLPLTAVGFGLFQQRFVNGIWSGLAVAIAAVWLARKTRPAWGLALVLFVALSSPWMYFTHLGKTYGFSCLLVMLGAWSFLTMKQGLVRNFIVGFLAAMGVATRLPAAPYFGLLWLLACWPRRISDLKETAAGLIGLGIGLCIAVLPFWLAEPEGFRFWVFDFHRVSVPQKAWHLRWQEIATLAPAAWLLGVTGLLAAIRLRSSNDRRAGVLLAACASLAANLLPGGVYEEYAVPFLLPLVAAAAALVHEAIKHGKPSYAYGLTVILALAQALAAPLLFRDVLPQRRATLSMWLPYNAPAYNPKLPDELTAARKFVREIAVKDAPFVGSNLILATETGQPVPAELRMGPFAFTDEMSPERASRLHLATPAQLDAWFTNPRVGILAFFPNSRLNYSWSMPSFDLVPDEVRAARFAQLMRLYDVRHVDGDFFLLVRKPQK
jgi:4-amino-4-deoxy-L-arabinose transferase-like glycosyltransferase